MSVRGCINGWDCLLDEGCSGRPKNCVHHAVGSMVGGDDCCGGLGLVPPFSLPTLSHLHDWLCTSLKKTLCNFIDMT